MIQFDHVSKEFGASSVALSDITVEIRDGEFVFLIGASGAGKSTFLRLILRDLLPTSGIIIVDDWDITKLPQSKIHLLRRKVGMVFQDFKLLIDRTIYENVALGLEILGKSKEETEKGVVDVLELVGLSNKKNSFPLQLSAGEMQRVSIARAIVGGPKILLADEPTGNLDPDTSWDIMQILREIHSLGTTVIVATHNAAFVNEMKKRTITIKNGEITSDEEKGRYHQTERGKEHRHHHSEAHKEK
ncbi:MAG: Cell division ATP-binding protein [Candidatus Gottesmanbacteria bacterium GW2011_GWA2_44_17]|uniref:Cell division ATP-binding protein FtsE n=3 Tax=Candidatus Gottesmaniibacteriota TaxID=1752720 RepID=A0A0G1IHH6_9BACT|nr:MAG: cell division ATP-binding protein FtsE, cell division transport system ATP-binding protein [Microgenomates group bacterium GW2011_GWC1_43_11]KKT36664.1 MAG: Cell division ATP-binding protein [Candidatus Gottesmanbacteria bacterium GW2011_GWB1_44_11c]KKT46767.1 MAG: Cell division ATP-binding protein [Candidatus Gottesmanbacteria bacterium GW2011_GWA2_44_17]KKT58313.1 MAG: Cell division ATP-binding protein [Candidatus Gottesmanbacteria bacterium GW2011_GWA1_44_24b]HCM82729.1 cell division